MNTNTVLALRHVPHESLGSLADRLRAAGLAVEYVDLFAHAPADLRLDALAGLVVLGGPMNVDQTDRYPFLAAEVEWLREACRRQLPTLGICLGSQLLAKALGARVYANRVKEIGWYSLELTAAAREDSLFAGSQPTQTVFQWHGDTFDLPAGAVHLAQSADCRHQAFRYGPCAWGLQFHIEVTPAMVEDWLREPENHCELESLPYIDPAAIRQAIPEQYPRMQQLGDRVLGRFAALCQRRAAGRKGERVAGACDTITR